MKKINIESVAKNKVNSPLFTGIVEIQSLFYNKSECDLSINYVHFPEGIHNKFHKHSTDQILIVTEGKGFVETKVKKINVKTGDIIWTPKGEIHKHGALSGSKFSHISITRSKSKIIQVED